MKPWMVLTLTVTIFILLMLWTAPPVTPPKVVPKRFEWDESR